MADLSEITADNLDDLDIEELLARVESKSLTFSRTKSLNQAPEFSKRLSGDDTVDEGCPEATLECKVLGFPRPELFWYKDADLIHPDHPRMRVEEVEGGSYVLTIKNVTKGDEAGYKCKAVNIEGETSSTFFLFVKAKPKKGGKRGKKRRRVSYPPMFATIVEKVEEEERAAKEARYAPPSPLSELYVGITLKSRHTWPKFLGEWAFAEDTIRSCSECSVSEDGMDDSGDGRFIEGPLQDDVFHPGERTLPPSPDSPGSDATNQFYIGEIEDNEEIKISASTYLNSIAKKIGHSMSPVTKATVPTPLSSRALADICNSNTMDEKEAANPNNVLTNQLTCTINKPLTKPNNLSLASNCTPSAPKMHRRDNNANPRTVQSRYQNGQSPSACLLDNRICTSRSLVARRSGRMRNENIRIHVRECVLVLIVFTFLSLCFGISCGRFVATVLGLHIIYAVSKSLLEK